MLTQLGRQLVSVTVALLNASSTGDVQHLNDQNCESTESHSTPSPLLHPTTKAFSLFITMIMGQKPERAPCLCTISFGDGFVAMSCVSLGAECVSAVKQKQSLARQINKMTQVPLKDSIFREY